MSAVLNDNCEPEVKMLDETEAVTFFEGQVQSLLGISAEDFLTRRAKGEYKDACDNPRVLKLLMMVPKALAGRDHK